MQNDEHSSSDSELFLSLTSDNGSSSDDSFLSIPSLSDTLSAQFTDVPKNLNVIHINAQSIPAHYPEMLATFDQHNIHAILVSESWLKPCLPSTSYAIPGFILVRNDRTDRPGGGVAIYLRSNIPYTIINLSTQPPPANAGEHLFLELTLSHTKILIGVYYSPNKNVDYFSSFENLLEDLLPSYPHTVILGDFNTCLLKNDSRCSKLKSIIHSSNMYTLPLSATHHFPDCAPSLLDLIFVSSLQHVAKHGQCSHALHDMSYHDVIYLSYKIRPPRIKSKVLLQRSFGSIDVEKLRDDARNIDWSPVHNTDAIDEKISIFNNKLIQLYDVHAPLRSVKIKHLPAPWLSEHIKKLMHQKAVAKSKLKSCPSDVNKLKFQLLRNRCNRVCRDAQRHYIHKSVENGDPAKVWKFLRSLGVGKSRHNSNPHDLDVNSLNQHFASSSNIDVNDKLATILHLSSLPTPNHSPFVINQFAACDVKKSILSISSNAVGSDSVSRNMIVPILDDILPILCHLLNSSVSQSAVPSCWKEAQIVPIPKKPNPKSLSEYRPISILPFLSKVLERLIHSQLSHFLNRNNLLNPLQSGFRPGHSTVTALVKITDDIRLGMENQLLTVLTLLDFSNAFNAVDFDILLASLRSINISPSAIDWFRSYLYGRRQRVRVEDYFSSWCDTSSGVPQGGVLSPLLFAVFINSITSLITSSYHLYADDLQIYSQAPLDRLGEAVVTVNADLRCIERWSKSYGLTVNPSKTQAIIIGSSRLISRIDRASIPKIMFGGISVPFSTEVKNLGIIFDSCLSWGPQLQSVKRKLYGSAAALRRLRNFLPTATKVALAQSLLLPILDYADACYLDLTQVQLDRLERLQNLCIRFIFGLRKYDHVSQFRTKLKWLPIRLRRDTHTLSLLYSTLFNPSSPSYLSSRFNFYCDTHSNYLRSSTNLFLSTPSHSSTLFYGASFSVRAVALWNALPVTIRRAQSLESFKAQIKLHYLSNIAH